jgi:hypothetical protein
VPKGSRIDASKIQLTADLQRLWWEGHGKELIQQAQPDRIVAIGKGLFQNMGAVIPFDSWIYQPQGARSAAQMAHNCESLERLRIWLTH